MTLLFIHGAGFTGAAFAAQLAAFPGAHAPNLPGHEAPASGASVADFAGFIGEYVRFNALDEVVLCGHSMGAAVALECALSGAGEIAGLVLLGGGARLRVAPAILEGLERDFEGTCAELAGFFFADATPERRSWSVAQMRRAGQAQTLRDFRACDAFDVLPRLEEIHVPLLAITGEYDKMTPPKYAQTFVDRVPGAEARIIEGAGHFVMAERPEETNHAIAAFLSGIA